MIDQEQVRLERRLYSRMPLFGAGRRRRAAETLARLGSAWAIRVLAEALIRNPDARVQDIARDTLRGPQAWPAVDAAVQIWVESRHPDLTALLLEQGWVATRPVSNRVLSALKTDQLDLLAKSGANVVQPLLDACQDPDADIAGRAPAVLARLEKEEAQTTLCQIFAETGSDLARQAILQAGLPRNPVHRALFLFLTDQWEAYQALDFDQSLLRPAYQAGSPELRRRILEKIRRSGRTDFLDLITGRDVRARLEDVTENEARLLVEMLAAGREWAQLWDLVFELPLAWSVHIVHLLAKQGWQPENEEEGELLARLRELTGQSMQLSSKKIVQQLPPAVQRARTRLRGRINALAFSPDRPVLGLGTGQGRVVEWDFHQAERVRTLGPLAHSISQVAYAGNGSLLAAERSRGRTPCAVYVWNGNSRMDLGSHQGAVTALAPFGDRYVLSAGREGRLAVWDLQAGRMETGIDLDFWPRSVRISRAQNRAALLHEWITTLDLPGLDRQHHDRLVGQHSVARCAAFTPDDGSLLVGRHNGRISIHDLGESRTRHKYFELPAHTGNVQGIEVLDATRTVPCFAHNTIITAGAEGLVRFLVWEDQSARVLGQVQAPGERLTSLHVSPGGAFMATGDANAFLSLWDLRVLDLPHLFTQPLGRAVPGHLAAIAPVLNQGGIAPDLERSLRFLELVIRHRFRFDIDVEEMPAIRVGEFDIEVE